jgi:hypothetical protein
MRGRGMSKAGLVRVNQLYEVTDANVVLRESALALLRQIVAMKGVLPNHHREQVSLASWKWTEAFGQAPHAKYNLRYVSRGVVEAAPEARINHEHVFPRRWLVEQLLKIDPFATEFETFLDQHGVACVVSVEEHAALGASPGPGWMRYVHAGIEVFDRAKQEYVEPAALMPGAHVRAPIAEEPQVVDPDLDPTIRLDRGPGGTEFVLQYAKPEVAAYILRLARTAELALGVTLPQQTAGTPKYFRVHDAVVEEPTRAAAYVNFNGTVDLALAYEDLPDSLKAVEWVTPRNEDRKPYLVRCVLTDAHSLESAEDLLGLALERIRDEYSVWG